MVFFLLLHMENTKKTFWLISAPKTREDTFITLNKKTSEENDLSLNFKFNVPDLKVGTLDSLLTLSDELVKIDTYVELSCKKISDQLFDITFTEGKSKEHEHLEILTVNNTNVDQYMSYFRWDEAKFPTANSLKALTDQIHAQVGKLDEELKTKSLEYNNLVRAIAAEDRKASGSYATRDISEVVKQKHIVDSEYLQTIFVAVPKISVKEWFQCYEKLTDFVIPRSSELIDQDNEYHLFRVIVFKKVADEYKEKLREKKYTIRDFVLDENRGHDRQKMESECEKQKKLLIRWCKTNFSEAFVAWVHLKAIRIFVESVLRYGLPTNFQAVLLMPKKGKEIRLRKVLLELYGHLSSKALFKDMKEDDDDDSNQETFYPYVSLEIVLEPHVKV